MDKKATSIINGKIVTKKLKLLMKMEIEKLMKKLEIMIIIIIILIMIIMIIMIIMKIISIKINIKQKILLIVKK